MAFQAVKGTRDFYPDAMRVRNWIVDAWRRVSLRNGFEEYDSPIFEYLDLLTAKSGPEIAEQLFSFTDRGGRNLAIRPEITPSLARMVNAKINSLPRPIKWFSVPRVCRAENPQRGRLREFFQWNIDVIGEDSVLADAECLFVLVDCLRELGFTSNDVVVKYSSRALATEVIKNFGVSAELLPKVLALIDKRRKVPEEAFQEMLKQLVSDGLSRAGISRFLNTAKLGASPAESISLNVGTTVTQEMILAQGNMRQFQRFLRDFGIEKWCQYDPNIVRGLAYYTGIVYEVFDAGQSLRAVAGGGRYDNLLEVLGGPKVGATGFGMGDVVLGILLEEKGKLPKELAAGRLDFYIIDAEDAELSRVMEVVGGLRAKGLAADFSYKRQALGKQLKEANRRGAAQAVIVRGDNVTIKNLSSGEQKDRTLTEFLTQPND